MSPQHPRFTRFRRVMGVVAATASIAIIAAGCSADANTGSDSQYGFPAPDQVKDSPITIWVDALRKRGYTHAAVLDEGINEWHRRGLPVVAAPGVTPPPQELMPRR